MAILAYDDVMLREPRLLVPWMQPLGLCRLADCGLPQPTSLWCPPAFGLLNAVGKKPMPFITNPTSASTVIALNGIAFKNSDTPAKSDLIFKPALPLTLGVVFYCTSNTVYDGVIGGRDNSSGNPVNIALGGTSNAMLAYYLNKQITLTGLGSRTNRLISVAVSFESGNTTWAGRDSTGEYNLSGTDTQALTSISASNYATIGHEGYSTRSLKGGVFLGAVWENTKMTIAQLRSFVDNPYQLVAPA